MNLPPETIEQVRRSKLYLENKHLVKESELNRFYEYVLKHGTLPRINKGGFMMTDKR